MDFAELELTFTQPASGPVAPSPVMAANLWMRFRRAGSDADQEFPVGAVTFDLDALRAAANTFDDMGRPAYGLALAEQVFPAGSAARAALREYLALAAGSALRVQVTTGTDGAAALQQIVWEALRDPESGALLTTGERIWFSRYLLSQDPRPVMLRPRAQLRAVLAAASPGDLRADPIAVEEELARAREALGEIESLRLPDGPRRATLDNLTGLLRPRAEGGSPADVLYLVCHGQYAGGAATLFLEDERGSTAPVAGEMLVARLAEFVQLPRLVVLVSCESAGTEQPVRSGVMSALGPLLARAGVPAVLAMHGRVSMATMARFLPALFAELQRDGQIDRAVAVARGAVREAFDAWMPVLFLRSKSGRLWQAKTEEPAPDLFRVEQRGGLGVLAGAVAHAMAGAPRTGVEVSEPEVQAAANFAHLTQFVDRVDAFQHFTQIIAAPPERRQERILAFVGPEGMGKNWLLDRLEFECAQRGVRYARLELEDDAINSPLAILHALALAFGGDPAARWLDLYRVWRIGDSGQSLEETPYAKDPLGGQRALSEAFLKMLGELAVGGPVALLFDSLDSPSLPEPTRRWLIETLLDQAREIGGYGVLPVVSLSEPPDYANRLWARLEVHLYEHMLEAFDRQYIRQYLRLRGLPEGAIESSLEDCLQKTGGVPLRVAGYARQLMRTMRSAGGGGS